MNEAGMRSWTLPKDPCLGCLTLSPWQISSFSKLKGSLVMAMLGAVASSASSLTRGGTAQRQSKKSAAAGCQANKQIQGVCVKGRLQRRGFSSGCLCRAGRVRIPSQSKGRKTKIDVRVPPRRLSDNPHIPWVRDLQASAPKTCGFQGTRCISTRQMQVMTDAICTIKTRGEWSLDV